MKVENAGNGWFMWSRCRASCYEGLVQPLSFDLDREDVQPYFIWDIPVTVRELRERIHHPDPAQRALWIARVMREARYKDVWKLVKLADILAIYPRIRRHLGRSRAFWDFLIDGWRDDGLIPRTS